MTMTEKTEDLIAELKVWANEPAPEAGEVVPAKVLQSVAKRALAALTTPQEAKWEAEAAHVKNALVKIFADAEIGERAAEIMRAVAAQRPDPSPEDLAVTPAEPGLYLDRLGNVWQLYQDGIFSMVSRIRASAARYAPFKRLVVAAPPTPQEGDAPEWEYGAALVADPSDATVHADRLSAGKAVAGWNESVRRMDRLGARNSGPAMIVRRRKAGSWLPVGGETDGE